MQQGSSQITLTGTSNVLTTTGKIITGLTSKGKITTGRGPTNQGPRKNQRNKLMTRIWLHELNTSLFKKFV
jgi:hypothetical protein